MNDQIATPDTTLDEIADDLAPRGATAGAMFGKRALTAHGKAFACLKADVLAFRLGDGTPPTPTPSRSRAPSSSTPRAGTARSATGSPCRSRTSRRGPATRGRRSTA